MAEFGVAAGIIGVVGAAQQLSQAIVNIRRFCKDVRNAPQELWDTLGEIERMHTWLEHLS
jgi:hypothetical protein